MELNTDQEEMLQTALGKREDFPSFTLDPRVNHAVDMVVCNSPPWEKLSKEKQDLYFEEVRVAKKEFL